MPADPNPPTEISWADAIQMSREDFDRIEAHRLAQTEREAALYGDGTTADPSPARRVALSVAHQRLHWAVEPWEEIQARADGVEPTKLQAELRKIAEELDRG